MLVDLLLGFLALMTLGSLPVWPYSRRWSYAGTAGVGCLLVLVSLLVWKQIF